MFESIYSHTVNIVMILKLVCVVGFAVVIPKTNFFQSRKFWRNWFLIGCVIIAVGLGGDIVDGVSTLEQLHRWSLLRHVGVLILFSGAYGMHWDLWKVPLFKGSFLEKYFIKKSIND